jgi:hypothetical protein
MRTIERLTKNSQQAAGIRNMSEKLYRYPPPLDKTAKDDGYVVPTTGESQWVQHT